MILISVHFMKNNRKLETDLYFTRKQYWAILKDNHHNEIVDRNSNHSGQFSSRGKKKVTSKASSRTIRRRSQIPKEIIILASDSNKNIALNDQKKSFNFENKRKKKMAPTQTLRPGSQISEPQQIPSEGMSQFAHEKSSKSGESEYSISEHSTTGIKIKKVAIPERQRTMLNTLF